MAVDHLFASFILLLISNTGFSAEISVFVQMGDSVQLDIQTQELPEFDDLSWKKIKSENIVKYTSETKRVRLLSSYKDRVDFNNKTFSLTLKNMQKTDSGLYTAIASAESDNNIVTYRVSVIGESHFFVGNFCTVSFTCRAHELMIDSSYQNNSCSPEEVTSQINTLILDCSEESIICNHSNPVSWKEDRINITQLCEGKYLFQLSYSSSYMAVLIIVCVVVGVIVFAGLVLYCCCKNKTGLPSQINDLIFKTETVSVVLKELVLND
uniref:Si:ch211-209f23.6 n=1 Tax=Sinocyclocheilus anshuiensis TaxID=1608454 RepID=A0A671KVY6_9TELE